MIDRECELLRYAVSLDMLDRIAVMYAGRIVELAPTPELFDDPQHPYTRALVSAVPEPDPDCPMNMGLSGEVADPGHLPPGCAFHPRCGLCRVGQCDRGDALPLREVTAGHFVACPYGGRRDSQE